MSRAARPKKADPGEILSPIEDAAAAAEAVEIGGIDGLQAAERPAAARNHREACRTKLKGVAVREDEAYAVLRRNHEGDVAQKQSGPRRARPQIQN